MQTALTATCIALALSFSSSVALPVDTRTNSTYDYYAKIDRNARGQQLLLQLQKVIANTTQLSYDQVWKEFAYVDQNLHGCTDKDKFSQIGGLYSNRCWKVGPSPKGQQCGNYKKEGDCYNREHGWPKSWWGGMSRGRGAQTDLFVLYPTDGYVNGLRGNLPLGQVPKPDYTSSNGCKIGICSVSGYDDSNKRCFEVADIYKGNMARSYFYVATTYHNKFSCCDDEGVNKSNIKPWMEQLLRKWHELDPPDANEVEYNNEIHRLQYNRNPYIDHPEWVGYIDDF